jgi:hypothetical protein
MDGPAVLVAWLLLYPALSLFSSALVEAQAANILLTFKCICCKKEKHRGHWGNFKPNFRTELLKACTICGILLICITVRGGGQEGREKEGRIVQQLDFKPVSPQTPLQVAFEPGRSPGIFPHTEGSPVGI